MSQVESKNRRNCFAQIGLLFVFGLLLSGCYTRQIDGIQKDLDSLERKLHTVSSKGKDLGSVDSATSPAMEDKLAALTQEQQALSEELVTLRSSMADEVSSGPGGSGISKSEIQMLKSDMASNREKTDKLAREVAQLDKTFSVLKEEIRTTISMFGAELEGEIGGTTNPVGMSATPGKSVSASNTILDGPSIPPTPVVSPKVVKATPSSSGSKSYRVKPGETLSGIAKDFNVSIDELKNANGIANDKNLRMGQEIAIP